MRTLAIGDIHGCLTALKSLTDFVDFSPEDTIITLGDYIDRGPDSKGVIDFLLDLKKKHHLITLKGNHESMMLNSRHYYDNYLINWLLNGGVATLDSFNADDFDQIDEKYWNFLTSCQLYHETDHFIFAHAGLAPDLALDEQSEESLLWLRFNKTKQHQSGKCLICGHTPQKNRKPTVKKHAICIDTAPVYSGWLTCLDTDSGQYWQANETGKTRDGKIKKGCGKNTFNSNR